MRPADTTRTSAFSQSIIAKQPLEQINNPSPVLTAGPALYTSVRSPSQACQVNARESRPLRLAIAQAGVSFTDEFLNRLLQRGIIASVTSPESILRTLDGSPREYEIVVYPVSTQSQRAVEFMRVIRRLRERNGGIPYPKSWIISEAFATPRTPAIWRLAIDVRSIP